MPKNKKQAKKELEKEVVRAVVRSSAQQRPPAPPKKKKGGWSSFLSGAAKIAMEAAPALLEFAPLLLANHPPTAAAALQSGINIPVQQSPIASGGVMQNMVGIHEMQPLKQGKILFGERVRGCDKLGDIVTGVSGAAQGGLVFSKSLNFTDADWEGTRLNVLAKTYNRYRVRNLAFCYVPACPTTTEGSLIFATIPDPDEPYTGTGFSGTQKVSSLAMSELASVWQCLCTAWTGDASTNFYADEGATDARFTSPGFVVAVANTDLPVSTTFGSVYACYDLELSVPEVFSSTPNQFVATVGSVSYALATPLGNAPTGGDGWSGYLVGNASYVNPEITTRTNTMNLVNSVVGGASRVTGFPSNRLIQVQFGVTVTTSITTLSISVGNSQYLESFCFGMSSGAGTYDLGSGPEEAMTGRIFAFSQSTPEASRTVDFTVTGSGTVASNSIAFLDLGPVSEGVLSALAFAKKEREWKRLVHRVATLEKEKTPITKNPTNHIDWSEFVQINPEYAGVTDPHARAKLMASF